MPPNGTRAVLFLLVLLAAGVLMLVWWPTLLAPDSASPLPTPTADPAAAARPGEGGLVAAMTPAAAPSSDAREAVHSGADDNTGSLLVHVLWGDDKQPAADLVVKVWRPGVDELFDGLEAPTDPTGTVLFERLAPGNVYPQIARGRVSEHERVAIVAGERVEVTLTLKVGMNAKGRVVDGNGAPVAGAEIVFADWGGGRSEALAHSADDGTFALRGIDTHCHIGARKEGMKPSSLRQFTASEGATVEFTIVIDALGASLAGVVLDPDGKPIAGAVLRAGDRDQKNHTLPDGASAMGPQCEYVRSDELGRFRFASVVPGKLPLAARARGLAPWQETVDVAAGRTEQLTIRLLPGVTVFGTVRDQGGKPIEKVDVAAGDWDDLGSRSVRTAADGTFRLEGLAAGALPVRAENDKRGKVAETLQVTAGEQRRWDPVLSAGLQLRGRVVDADDKPLASVMVEGQLERPSRGDSWWAFENTDADGRFVLNNCKEGGAMRLSFKRKSVFPELVMTGVVPQREDLVVHLPKEAWVWIQGTVLGPDDEALPNVHVSPFKKDSMSGSPAETTDAKTGAFRYGPYPPGTYGLRVSADGFPAMRVPDRTLGPDETWDLGTLRFQRGGTLVVNPLAAGEMPKLSLHIYDADGTSLENLQLVAGVWRSSPLPVGPHELHVGGEGVAVRVYAFEILPGAETRLDVPIAMGAALTIECVLPPGAPPNRAITLVVRDAERIVWRGNAWAREGQPAASLALAPGTYSIEASLEDLRASGSLVVDATAPAKTTKLELRRP